MRTKSITTSIRITIAGALFLVFAGPAGASADRLGIAGICEGAALVASRESGVPLDVLRAISLTETGRRGAAGFLPWPWTVNMEGAGKWFDSAEAALDYVNRNFARGARSFDVGCFQLNYRWHGKAFASIEDMFDPVANARYAARFLRDLHTELGDWTRAAGAYHSRTPKYATKYAARFDRIREGLGDQVLPLPTIPDAAPVADAGEVRRPNLFPLLLPGPAARSPASLVPLGAEARGGRFIELVRAEPLPLRR